MITPVHMYTDNERYNQTYNRGLNVVQERHAAPPFQHKYFI
ncbi:hypothetical protein [Paenibacillus barcinonensis]|nr:hypothetical protein [Paenibacillus barcinonensis]